MTDDDDPSWKLVATSSELDGRDAVQVVVDDNAIAIYRIDGTFYATSGACTHAQAQLCDGYVEGDIIECPLHAGRFHIPTGKAIGAPATKDLKVYPVKVLGADIFVLVT